LDGTLIPGQQGNIDLTADGQMADLGTLGVKGDYTVRRIRGVLGVVSALGTETNAPDVLAWGIGIIENDALLATTFPDVRTDPFDWMGYGHVIVPLESAGLTAAIHPTVAVELDIKSMRKVNENHQSVVKSLKMAQ